jgi:uncharacterized membrane protein
MENRFELPPIALAGLTLLAGFVVGLILMVVGHVFIGIMVAGVAIPVALVVWMVAGD